MGKRQRAGHKRETRGGQPKYNDMLVEENRFSISPHLTNNRWKNSWRNTEQRGHPTNPKQLEEASMQKLIIIHGEGPLMVVVVCAIKKLTVCLVSVADLWFYHMICRTKKILTQFSKTISNSVKPYSNSIKLRALNNMISLKFKD
jgi:hypothetical protein